MWRNFTSMPLFLKFITIHGFMFFVGAFLTLLPIPGFFRVNDKTVSYQEWWSSGNGIEFFIVALMLGVGAICLVKKVKHARKIYLTTFAFAFLVMMASEANQNDIAAIFISGLIPFVLIYWYLFHVKSVQNYYIKDL